jgi:hypothetical protein
MICPRHRVTENQLSPVDRVCLALHRGIGIYPDISTVGIQQKDADLWIPEAISSLDIYTGRAQNDYVLA